MKLKKIIKRYINQYVERRLAEWILIELQKYRGIRYPDIFYRWLYPANVRFLRAYAREYAVYKFRYLFLFESKLVTINCYIVNNQQLYRERENIYVGTFKGEKYYLMDAVSTTHMNIFEIKDYMIWADERIERAYWLNNYLFKKMNTIISPDNTGYYEFELLEKSIAANKHYFFLRIHQLSKKIIRRHNWFRAILQEKNLDQNKILWQSSSSRNVEEWRTGLLKCYDYAEQKVTEYFENEYKAMRIFYVNVTPIKFRIAKQKWDDENDPVAMAEVAKKKKEKQLKQEKKQAWIDKMTIAIEKRIALDNEKKAEKKRILEEKRALRMQKKAERQKEKLYEDKLKKERKRIRLEKKKQKFIQKQEEKKNRLLVREKKKILILEKKIMKLYERYKNSFGDRINKYVLNRSKEMRKPSIYNFTEFKLNCYLKLREKEIDKRSNVYQKILNNEINLEEFLDKQVEMAGDHIKYYEKSQISAKARESLKSSKPIITSKAMNINEPLDIKYIDESLNNLKK